MAENNNPEATQKPQNPGDVEEVTMESSDSELINTSLFNQDTESEAEEEKKEAPKKSKAIKVNLDPKLLFAILALVIAGAIGFMGMLEMDNIARSNSQKSQSEATQTAQKIHFQLLPKIRQLSQNFVSKTESLIQTPESSFKQASRINALANEIFPGAKLAYQGLPINSEGIIGDPALGYAYLDLLNDFLSPKNQQNLSKFELLKPSSEYEQAILVRPIRDEENKVSGFISLFLPSKALVQELFATLNPLGGHVLIKQNNDRNQLYVKGAKSADSVKAIVPIAETNWLLDYTYPNDKYAFSFDAYLMLIIYAAIALILLILALVLIALSLKQKLQAKKAKAAEVEEESTIASLKAISKNKTAQVDEIKEKDGYRKEHSEVPTELEIEPNTIPDAIFQSYDIRGIVGKNLNEEVFHLLGKAIANEMDDMERSEIVVGHDGRNSSASLTSALVQGLMDNGLKVYDMGMVPTPLVYYGAIDKANGCGVMVTASRHPREYNGLKLMLDGEIFHGDKLRGLQHRFEDNELADPGTSEPIDIKAEYVQKLSYLTSFDKKFKVAIDCGNGVASLVIVDLLKQLGCDVISIYEDIDGQFPNHQPDPSKTENLSDLIQTVKEQKADIGFAFDADGDRLGVISNAGEIIWSDRLLMLLAKDVLSRNPGARVLFDVKSSSSLHEWIIQHGGEPEMCPSGHANIKERMKVSNALLAAEFSGHIFNSENWYAFDDPYYAVLQILALMANDGRTSQAIFADIPDKINTPEILIPVQPGQGDMIMQKILEQKSEFGDAGLVLIDGLRAEYEDGWGVVRASKTDSKLSLRFEADSPEALQRIAEKFKEVVLSVVFVKFPY